MRYPWRFDTGWNVCCLLRSPVDVRTQSFFDDYLGSGSPTGAMMKRQDFQAEIQELNLAYLMLAQQMLRSDRETAMFRLGIGSEIAELIEGLSSAQLVKMAKSQMLLPGFRFDDALLAGLLAGKGRDATTSSLHAAILAAGKPVRNLESSPETTRSGNKRA
jgi:flagellar transcriptional activator FlhD